MNTCNDRTKLQIGAYCLAPYARTEEHIRDIAKCGIELMVCVPNDRELLDHLEACGIGAVVSGVAPAWFGGTGEKAGQMAQCNPLEQYSSISFGDHPAVRGIDIGDEPSAKDFQHYGRVYERVRAQFPDRFPYLNLYPSYGMVPWNTPEQVVQQLGVEKYEEYLESYCKHVPSDYLCFDFYPYAADVDRFWSDLDTAAKVCRRYARSLWVVLQVNSHVQEMWTSENRLRLQAYSALAFGAESISWACYSAGWWHNQVLDDQGEKTQQYEKLRRVNAELHSLGETYMRYRCVSTHIAEGAPLNIGAFRNVCAENGERLIIGEMVPRSGIGRGALMICAANDPMDERRGTFTLRFSVDEGAAHAIKGASMAVLTQDENEVYSVELDSCGGMMLIAEEDDD